VPSSLDDPVLRQANLRLAAGRAKATDLMPYLADALYAAKAVASTDLPTLAIDSRWRMYYNPEFVLSCSVEEVAGAWLHEIGHPLREHGERFQALREPAERLALWNRAGDCAINADLRLAGVRLPAVKAWFPERVPGAEVGMTAEQVYRLLLNGPEGRRLAEHGPSLVLLPDTLRHDEVPATVVALTRDLVLDATATVVLLGGDGEPVTGPGGPVLGPLSVRDPRGASFPLTSAVPAGRYDVVVTRGGDTARAALTITAPTVQLRPDHLRRDRGASEKVVVVGEDTHFATGSRVHVLHPDGRALDVVTEVTHVGDTLLTFVLGQVPDGAYRVRIRSGDEVVQAVLPVGLPHLDLNPSTLPSGHVAPVLLAGTLDDLALDATTTIAVLDAGGGELDGAAGPPDVRGEHVLNVALRTPLDDGHYVVAVTTATARAQATLTVGGQDPGDGEGSNPPDTDGEEPGRAEETTGPGGADQSSEAGSEEADPEDCGSGAGGSRRPWEQDETGTDPEGHDDGSVDAGRAELIRQQTARNVLEHARSRGSVPAGWERWANLVLEPEVDWRKEMNSITRRVSASVAGMRDYSYARPSRRAAAFPNVVMPSMRQPRPPRVAEVVDTSGSVSEAMLGQVHAETEAIVKRSRGEGVTVISCDAAASRPQTVRSMNDVRMVGGGGTDMRVGLQAAAQARPKFDLVITMTDGDTPWPTSPPPENPDARYVVLLLDGDRESVPGWMHKIVIRPDRPGTRG
jgi:predicted metal-dependent peptidase